jgi:hypothetical protein
MNIKDATNKARYVEWLNDYTFAVWSGGHTINFYSYDRHDGNVENFTCINVGSFENNNATLQEVKEGIESFELYE